MHFTAYIDIYKYSICIVYKGKEKWRGQQFNSVTNKPTLFTLIKKQQLTFVFKLYYEYTLVTIFIWPAIGFTEKSS